MILVFCILWAIELSVVDEGTIHHFLVSERGKGAATVVPASHVPAKLQSGNYFFHPNVRALKKGIKVSRDRYLTFTALSDQDQARSPQQHAHPLLLTAGMKYGQKIAYVTTRGLPVCA